MMTVFRYALARSRGQIIGWGMAVFLLGLLLVPFYDTLVDQQDQLLDLLSAYPPELMAFFGDMQTAFTPAGYLNLEMFSYMPLILGVFALLAGSGLVVSDEENGTLDLLLAHPVSRSAMFAGRLLAFVVATLCILAIGWLGLVIPMGSSQYLDLSLLEAALPFLSLFSVLMLFGSLGMVLSVSLPSRRLAAMLSGFVLAASFFITSLARVIADLETAADFSPLSYYQGGEAIDGLNAGWLVGLLAISAVFMALAWWRFQRRDIRVAGEGGWRLPWRRRRATV
jgi:ABC-2 type transport system permease protein